MYKKILFNVNLSANYDYNIPKLIPCEFFARKSDHKFIIYVMEYHFTSFISFVKTFYKKLKKNCPLVD